MLASWKAKRAAAKLVTYKFKGKLTYHKHEAIPELDQPALNADLELKDEIIIDLNIASGTFQLERTMEEWNSKKKAIDIRHGNAVFDGKVYKAMLPKQGISRTGEYVERRGDLRSYPLDDYFSYILIDSGLVPLRPYQQFFHANYLDFDPTKYSDSLKLDASSNKLLRVRCAPERVNDGAAESYVIIESNPTKDYSVEKHSTYLNKKLVCEYRFSHIKIDSYWHISEATRANFGHNGLISTTQTFAVTFSCATTTPELVIKPEKGMKGAVVVYNDAAERDSRTPEIKLGLEVDESGDLVSPKAKSARASTVRFAIAILSAMVVLVAGCIFVKRAKRYVFRPKSTY